MKRRHFLKNAGLVIATAPFPALLAESAWAALSKAKITDLQTIIVENEVYLKVFTDQGVVGEGHTAVHRKAAVCEAAVKDLGRLLIGMDPTRIEFIWQAAYRWPRWRGGPVLNAAISGIDLALWDIVGKMLDAPIYRLLGGAARDRIRLYVHVAGQAGLGVGREGVQRAKAMGYTAIKTSPRAAETIDGRRTITRPWNLKKSVRMIEEMREEAGDYFDILIDAHGLLTPVMALEYARAIEPYRVMFLEEPVQIEGNDTLEWLGDRTIVPLATGERHTTKWMFEDIIARRLVSYVQPDVIQCGGITELKKIAAMAEAQFIEVAPHGPGVLSTGLGFASLHVDACTANFAIQETHRNATGWRLDLLSGRTVTVRDGYAELPTYPGLGLKVDWDVARQHPHTPRDQRMYFEDGSVTDH